MITISKDSDHIFYMGSTFIVEWYFDQAGRMKAKEYFDSLQKVDKDRLRNIAQYLADSPIGTRLPKKLYNLEHKEAKIYAFKPRDSRFFNFMTINNKIIILEAYRKHSQKMTKKDLNLLGSSITARNDYIKRIEEGTYYERIT